jgi:hypothetical protein
VQYLEMSDLEMDSSNSYVFVGLAVKLGYRVRPSAPYITSLLFIFLDWHPYVFRAVCSGYLKLTACSKISRVPGGSSAMMLYKHVVLFFGSCS